MQTLVCFRSAILTVVRKSLRRHHSTPPAAAAEELIVACFQPVVAVRQTHDFTDADNRIRIAREEIFGPVLTIIPYETESLDSQKIRLQWCAVCLVEPDGPVQSGAAWMKV
ncbi:aldehyde dehydrogenase family protein [Pseudomonas bananamidigenes]|uniref:aldehyde dehydrogenase family protein n=1 Tax=Pseudomonas bananamidigenes TaxID=2843610 RepID=UPI0009E2E22C